MQSTVFPLKAIRSYNSTSSYTGGWGSNWRGQYDRSITFRASSSRTTASLNRADGRTLYYNLINSQWVGEADVIGRLTGNASAGWIYINPEDETETYDSSGRLTSIKNAAGLTQTLVYASISQGTKIIYTTTVSDPVGRKLVFTYDSVRRITAMTDPTGQIYTYTYSGPNPSDNLTSVTYPGNKTRTYLYGEAAHTSGTSLPRALTGLIDENGNRFATWSYDAQGRAISSEHAVGVEKVVLTYNPNGTTSVVDALGGGRNYQFQTILGVIKNTGLTRSPDGATSTTSYDSNGNVASRTDFNGVVTTYTYDLTRNLETSRTEAFGTAQARTITTTWHSTYRLPLVMAEPLRRTSYTYDANGNELTRTVQATSDTTGVQGINGTAVGTARIWTYTYNSVGQVLTATGPRTDIVDTTSYVYDTMGNLISVTNALNQTTLLSNYDLNGRVGKITDSNGTVTDLTYSPRGWLTSKITTAGTTTEATSYSYDGVGQLTKVTLPDGVYIDYSYDAAHRLTGMADSAGNSIVYTLDAMGNRTNEQVKDPSGQLAKQTTRVIDALNRIQQITGPGIL
ncbi:putative deoxyribonuclease RhsB [compost metagenome]